MEKTRDQQSVNRKADADRLITESQELFAQRKPVEAIQLLRLAYELDKSNSLARSILANALVEHAQSLIETDWLKAETLTNQALALNPAHPTAKTILSRIVDQKKNSSAEDWVSQASKLQSDGDLFGALAWVAEGLAVHPHDSKLLQIQDAIQRDQDARRRQARRGDLDDLRRMQREIDKAADLAAKQALAVRIQTIAAKHWTDGEILSIANALLLRLGLVPEGTSSASPRGKGATVILHVPRPSASKPLSADESAIPASPTLSPQVIPTNVPPSPVLPTQIPSSHDEPREDVSAADSPVEVPPSKAQPTKVPPSKTPQSEVPQSQVPLRTPPRSKHRSASPKPELTSPPVATGATAELSALVAKVAASRPKEPARSNFTTWILVSSAAGAIILFGAIFFFARKPQPVATTQSAAPVTTVPAASTPAPATPAPAAPAPAVSAPAQTSPEPSPPAAQPSSNATAGSVTPSDRLPAASTRNVDSNVDHNLGTLLIVAGQDDAKVFLNGKLQRQLTHAGELRLPNLEPKDYVVQVAKSGFQDPAQQKIRIRKGEEAKLIFNLQPEPRMASLAIQGGTPGATVLVDQTPVGTIQSDGTLSVATVNPGDHIVELRKDRFKPRQFKKHFVVGSAISLAAADAALEGTPGELKITFKPADANVAVVKGDLLKMVSSGVPLNLAPGTYTLTARTSDRFTRTSTFEVMPGQSKTLDLSLAPNGMSRWDDPGAWKQEKDSYIRKGGDFVLYAAVPASGTFLFSVMPAKGHLLQWVFNYIDSKNYVLFQIDDTNFYRAVIRNGQKTDEIKVPDKGDKKSFRSFNIRVSPTEIVHQVKHGDSWTLLDRLTQPGTNLSQGKFGFYIPGNEQVALSSFTHYADLNLR